MTDVTVVGLGPAGRALASRLAAAGASVVAWDPAPERAWWQTFGGWARQLPAWLPADVVGARPARTVLRAHDEHAFTDNYVVLDTALLQESLPLDRVEVRTGTLSDADVAALPGVVVDCRGSHPRRRPGAGERSSRRDVPAQTALGVLLPADVAAPAVAGADAVLMDWRPLDGPSWRGRRPSFCYVMPLPGGRVLVEETCLAGAPALGQPELAARLRSRLAGFGMDPSLLDSADHEVVHIPLLPAARRHARARFGAAGAQLNPISGYSVLASLAGADAAAASLLADGRLAGAPAGTEVIRRRALGAVCRLGGDDTVALFDAFGAMSTERQRAVLDPTTPLPALLDALATQWAGMGARGKVGLVAATAGLPSRARDAVTRDPRVRAEACSTGRMLAAGHPDTPGCPVHVPFRTAPALRGPGAGADHTPGDEPDAGETGRMPAAGHPDAPGCPVHVPSRTAPTTHDPDTRLARDPRDVAGPRVDLRNGMWHVRSLAAAREVLRARDDTVQAGFTAEKIPHWLFAHRPILIADGPGHDTRRKAVARFFAPTVVGRQRAMIEESAATLLADTLAGEVALLDEVALHFAVDVTSRIVGLDTPRPGEPERSRACRVRAMSARLEDFFAQPPFDLTKPGYGRTGRQWASAARHGLSPLVRFWWADVRPAIAHRRRHPGDDVLSHLIAQGTSDASILVEAVTYGTAGMVTTRELIAMAAWHVLADPDRRARWEAGDPTSRQALLREVVRLEPPVAHLYRRATGDLTLHDRDQVFTVRAGDLVDVHVRDTNADPDAVGAEPDRLCPGRELPRGVPDALLSFGDGAHKCPGQPLALLEAEIMVDALLARGAVLEGEPEVAFNDLVAGYTLRGMRVRLRR